MLPSKSRIHAREELLRKSQSRSLQARQQLRQSVRAAAVSPRGLTAGFILGLGTGRLLRCQPERSKNKGRRLRYLGFLLPLLRLL